MDGYKKLLLLGASVFMLNTAQANQSSDDPCNNILSIINRPSQSDSACPVPEKHFMIEAGANYLHLGRTYTWIFPQTQLRFGLPHDSELYSFVPNYIILNAPSPAKGFGVTVIGLKRRLMWNQTWILSMEGAVTLPAGSQVFGSAGTGYSVNGIAQYAFSDTINFLAMISANSYTMSSAAGGQRYMTYNPFVVVSYQPAPNYQLYAEVFGQSRTSYNQGAGFDCDAGIIYLLRRNLTVDIEAGQRISGIPTGYNNYLGLGLTYLT